MTEQQEHPIRIFVSYSHDSAEHADAVLALADRLRIDGIDCVLDQYEESPPEGWPRWMDRQLREADFVLVVCTATYNRRAMGNEEPGKGLGVRWESTLTYQYLYNAGATNTRFLPLLLDGAGSADIPTPLQGATHYRLPADYDLLYRRVTGQHLTPKPPVGARRALSPRPHRQDLLAATPSMHTTSTPRPITNVPYERNPFFTGREDVLQKLHEALLRTHAAVLSQVQAISGLGGIGKTQTVVEYTYRYQHEYQAILWIRAESESTLRAGFAGLAVLLGLTEQDVQNPNETVQAVHAWLTEYRNWLLVFDNADTPELLRNYRPKDHPHGHILLTSRASIFDQLGITTPLTLPMLPANDAVDFLFRRTGRDEQNPQERDAATRLAEELGYLPLALEQAGAYIVEQSALVQDYLTGYRKRRLGLLQHTPPKLGDYPHSVVTTWSLNFQQVRRSPGTIDVLRLSAFVSPDNIPLDLLVKGRKHLSPKLIKRLRDVEHDPLILNEVLEPLTRYSLIQRDVAMQTYNVHRMVQAVVRDQLDATTRRLWAERAMRAVNEVFPFDEVPPWSQSQGYLPHAITCLEQIAPEHLDQWEVADLNTKVALYLRNRGQYPEAEPFFQSALALDERLQGPEHPDTAQSLNNLANLYHEQGNYEQAEPLHQRALAIHEQVLGPEHPGTAQSLNNLASLYYEQGNYEQAEPLYQRALAIREQVLGPEHPRTKKTREDYTNLLQKLEQRAETTES